MTEPTSKESMEAIFQKVSNWGRWGAEDEMGALNLITPEKRARAAALAETGEVVSCAREFPVAPSLNGCWTRWNDPTGLKTHLK